MDVLVLLVLLLLWCCCLQTAGLQGGTKESGTLNGHSSLASWDEWQLHRLVAHFLAARFPILLALNKVGMLVLLLLPVVSACVL
jgi:hypothetical protein